MLSNRISIFVNLPLRSLDRLSLQRQLDSIGQSKGIPPRDRRRLSAGGLGTALLVATVVGSGIMAERLAGGNVAIALLGNTIPTGAILVVLILVLGPVSGAHFNPAVTLVFARRDALARGRAYIVVQFAGAWRARSSLI